MVARSYTLGRQELSLVRAVVTPIEAVAVAYEAGADRARGAFRTHLAPLLPAHARGDAEHWDPGPDSSLDDWARLGTYQGAVDAWEQSPTPRQCRAVGNHAAVWVAAYSTAYSAVAMHITNYQQKRAHQ